ncbi:serine-rich coiled-coil domain-containing protein 2 isoform X6 [Pipistrellus kuhlii]|uniref:serine-rich coiled-coil domain-containing protein 2 isoform X6 n=1 Tax=Pipistrellus kuhlii TaxID=59472 RepID=UPI001E26F7A8|nr:serine-rich coiled-coil domain-containing protein 2 isoform X6 [Pipistrellus kuhlii]
MEEKTQIKTYLGSKLPKYGTKSVRSTLQPMPTGTPVNLLGTSKTSSIKSYIKNNGSDCPSSHSFNWRTAAKYQLSAPSAEEPNDTQSSHDKVIDPAKHPPAQGMFAKNGIKGDMKGVSFPSNLAKPSTMFVSSTEELKQKSLSGPSSLGKFTKGTILGRTSYSLVSAPTSQLSGFYVNRSASSIQRPRANSCATRSSSGESLAQSLDNIKSLTCEKMVRSQSFSHSIQNSFFPPSSITRSHSFNRAADLKPYQNQHLPIRIPLRTSMLTRNSQQSELLNGHEHLGYGFNRPYAAGGKKLALSNGPGVASTGYRMVHPSLLKSSKSPFSGTITVDGNKNSPAGTCVEEDTELLAKDRATNKDPGLIENNSDRTENGQTMKHDAKIRYLSDDVDDISLSSLSSSDKNDLSEDFSDDFIDLEDSNRATVIPEENSHKEEKHKNTPPMDIFGSPTENEKSFSKADEWMDKSVSDRSEGTKHTSGSNLVSPDTDFRAGSSFELSPSDSSDGTYMWDEEGLEPIGNVHPIGSYESSEMNSIDILNNLESCDLEEDDLMLDVDLPEDASLENVECDNMNRFDRSDRNVRQSQEGFWKRSPQRWSGQEHYPLSHPDRYHHHGKSDLSRQHGVTATKNLKKKNAHMSINIPKPPGEEFLVGILLPPSLLGRAPSRGPHGLCHRTADRPQVLQPSSSLPRPTDPALGKLTRWQPREDRSEHVAQSARPGATRRHDSFAQDSQQERSGGLEGPPFSASPQLAEEVAESAPSKAGWDVAMDAPEPYRLTNNPIKDMQVVPTSSQTLTPSSAGDQAKRGERNQSLPDDDTSQLKSVQLLKPSNLSSLVPTSVPESSPSKNSPVIAPCNSAKIQLTSSQTNLVNNLNPRASKLRPPSGSFKQKQISNPRPEPQNFQAKTSIPRPLARRKEIMQNPNGNLNSGDCLSSNRYSRLPKPKIH